MVIACWNPINLLLCPKSIFSQVTGMIYSTLHFNEFPFNDDYPRMYGMHMVCLVSHEGVKDALDDISMVCLFLYPGVL